MTINILSDAELDAVSGGVRIGNRVRNGPQVNVAGVILLSGAGSQANGNTANTNSNNNGNNNSFANTGNINVGD